MKNKSDGLPQYHIVRIKRIARIGNLLCLGLALMIPVTVVGYLLSIGSVILAKGLGIEVAAPIAYWRYIGVLITLSIPAFLFSNSLIWLRSVFVMFGCGDYFSFRAFEALLQFSKWLVISVVLSIICQAMAPIWLGKSSISIQINSSEIMTIGVAILIYLLANILAVACEIDAENRQFV